MPELPEVETVRRYLQKMLLKPKPKKIKSIKLLYPGIVKQIDHKTFINTLLNQSFTNIDRYGKHLLLQLKNHTIISHLRMTGSYSLVKQAPKQYSKHDHIIFSMTDGCELIYSDTRKFGTMHLVERGKEFSHRSLSKLGPQVTDSQSFNKDHILKKCKNRSSSIKQFLLDQESVCGIGNIYADEILYSSSLNPERRASSITEEESQKIIDNGVRIMKQAIQNKGTTFLSFHFGQETGENVKNLKVYGRTDSPCQKCNTKIKKTVVAGRGTHFCPNCQPK